MPSFYSYQFAILGSDTAQTPGGPDVNYSDEPPTGTWSYSGDFTPFLIEQASDTATTLLGDPQVFIFDFDETIPFYAQSGTANAQEVDVDGSLRQLIWDYSFQVQDAGGNTYTIGVLDVDLNGNNTIEGNENGYFIVFQDGIPPPDVTLTITGLVADGFSVPHSTLGGEAVCFASGTTIETPDGLRAVETLKAGDLVATRDHGSQPLIWVGQSLMPAYGKTAPIVIPGNALGNSEELVVSPQHAVLIESWEAELLYGSTDVLVRAIDLLGYKGIHRREGGIVSYNHILFDRHHLVKACGIWSESLYPGDIALMSISSGAREEIHKLVPDLERYGPKAARYLRSFEAACLPA